MLDLLATKERTRDELTCCGLDRGWPTNGTCAASVRHGLLRLWEALETVGQRWPNCDPIVRTWVQHVVQSLESQLVANHVGTYLHGSLAAGGFYAPKSDVDLLFVCQNPLPVEVRRSFAHACVDLSRVRPIVGGLECSVILAEHSAAPSYPLAFEVHFSEDCVNAVLRDEIDYATAQTDPDLVVHCQAVLEVGVTMSGAPIAATFGTVATSDFVKSVNGDLEWILQSTHIAESPVYGVLNGCRMLWLWSGHSSRLVPTKEESAQWCLTRLPNALRDIVQSALAVYQSTAPVTPEDRRTGGLAWNNAQLLAFRDYLRQQYAAARR